MAIYPVRHQLPVKHYAEIGRIMTQWAYFESRLRTATYVLLDLNAKQGRLAVREPRAQDYPAFITELLKLRSLTIELDVKGLNKAIAELAFYRNAIAHGIWIKHDKVKGPVLQVVSNHPSPPSGKPKKKVKIDPQSYEFPLDQLVAIRKGIIGVTSTVNDILNKIALHIGKN